MTVDRTKTLEELEGQRWGDPSYPSGLVETCHRLRRVPLKNLSIGDLRVMIGQQIGLVHLIPLALEELAKDPLAEGSYYPGDLLGAVLGVDPGFWQKNPKHQETVSEILRKHPELPEELTEARGVFESFRREGRR